MNAPRPLPLCPACGEPAPTLYDGERGDCCGECLDREMREPSDEHEHDEAWRLALRPWREAT